MHPVFIITGSLNIDRSTRESKFVVLGFALLFFVAVDVLYKWIDVPTLEGPGNEIDTTGATRVNSSQSSTFGVAPPARLTGHVIFVGIAAVHKVT